MRYEYALPDHDIEYGVRLSTAEDAVHVDPEAQRTLNMARAQNIADNLQISAIGTVTVSQRADGSLWLVDGQHRRRALQLAGIPEMIAEVHFGLTQKQEAILFLIKNRESARPSAFDEYHIGLTGRVQQFVDTEEVLAKHLLKVGRYTTASHVGSIATVVRLVERFGPEALEWALSAAEEAWGRTDATWDGNLLAGFAYFYDKHPDLRARRGELAHKLSKRAAYQWVGDMHSLASGGSMHGSGSGGRSRAAYRLFVMAWNRNKSKRIPVPGEDPEE